MHHEPEEITCPNCGTHAIGNYCYECGQDNHLHKDTLWGLIMHFFEHYFHYDNKFWQTINTLLFNPGQLTIAYWKKQRMRYISPISLYIFISAVYFTLSFLAIPKEEEQIHTTLNSPAFNIIQDKSARAHKTIINQNSISYKINKNPEIIFSTIEKAKHNAPKVYFFMIPFTALLLRLVFIRRKELFFVDHLIFSLHFHSASFLFSIASVIADFLPSIPLQKLIQFCVFILSIVYLIRSLKVAYGVTTGKSLAITFFLGLIYFMVFASITGLIFFYYAHKLI